MSELYTKEGQRKYTTKEERNRFMESAKEQRRDVRTLCHVLALTGCRISEALQLTCQNIDTENKTIVFNTLKKRGKHAPRAVPVPSFLLDDLELVHELKKRHKRREYAPLWDWSRTHAYNYVKKVMLNANIAGAMATPKGLRHGFGVLSAETTRNPRLIMKWLGHSNLESTIIYMDAIGEEERALASRMW